MPNMAVFHPFYRICRLLPVIILSLESVFPPVALAAGLNEQIQAIQGRQAEVAREQAQVDLQIKLSSDKLVELQQRVNSLQTELNNTIAKRKSAEVKLNELRQKLETSRAELAVAKDRLAAGKKVFSRRLVSVYKNGEPNILEVVLDSTSFSDLIGRLVYMRRVAESDSRLVRGMKLLTATIANQVNQMEATKKAVDYQRRYLLAEENDIKTITASIIAEQSRIQEEVAKQQQLYAQKEQEKAQLARTAIDVRARAATAATLPSGELRELAVKFAKQYGIPTNIFLNLVTVESGWNPKATSRAGAIGLTQIMPYNAIANGFSLAAFRNSPPLQLELGAKYLSLQYRTFGRWDLALAAYNAGPGAVLKYGGIPPYSETQNYVRNIIG